MKKILFFLMASLATFGLMSFTNSSNVELQNANSTTVYASGSRSITVYKITVVGANGAAARQSFSAEFDEDKMELYVVERRNGRNLTMTYSVRPNPYKGYSEDPRGSYNYCAGAGDYYFN